MSDFRLVCPRVIGLLRTFRGNRMTVARQRRYHGNAFAVQRGVTQGDIVSPTIFNVVVEAVIRQWLNVVSDDSRIPIDGFVARVEGMGAFLYADDGLVGRDGVSLHLCVDGSIRADLFRSAGTQDEYAVLNEGQLVLTTLTFILTIFSYFCFNHGINNYQTFQLHSQASCVYTHSISSSWATSWSICWGSCWASEKLPSGFGETRTRWKSCH